MSIDRHTDDLPDELPEVVTESHGGLAPRQRSPRTDPSMRDGDSSHGNPYEMEGNGFSTDSDTGDIEDEPVHAGFDGGAADGTPADLRGDTDTDAADFNLRTDRLDQEDAELDEDFDEDDAPPALADVLPHPSVDAGRDGSTIGQNRLPSEDVGSPGLQLPMNRAEGVAQKEQSRDVPIAGYDKFSVKAVI